MHVAEETGGCIVSAGTTVCWAPSPHGLSDFGGRLRLLFSATSAFSANSVLNDKLRAAPDNSNETPAGIKDNFASSPPHGRAMAPADPAFPVRVKMLHEQDILAWSAQQANLPRRSGRDGTGRDGAGVSGRSRCIGWIGRILSKRSKLAKTPPGGESGHLVWSDSSIYLTALIALSVAVGLFHVPGQRRFVRAVCKTIIKHTGVSRRQHVQSAARGASVRTAPGWGGRAGWDHEAATGYKDAIRIYFASASLLFHPRHRIRQSLLRPSRHLSMQGRSDRCRASPRHAAPCVHHVSAGADR